MINSTQSSTVRNEFLRATYKSGFRRELGETKGWQGWTSFQSTTVPGTIHLAAASDQGPWFIALDHKGIIEALEIPPSTISGPAHACYEFNTLRSFDNALARVYELAASLPDAPLREFTAKTKDLPKTTEVELLIIQRIGQDEFRKSLIDYWQKRCPLTGITDSELLRASHIIPWSECNNDAERLDVYNGLLLSALWDAAFDRGLVTFDHEGVPQFSPVLSDASRAELRWHAPIQLKEHHRKRLAWHRNNLFIAKRN